MRLRRRLATTCLLASCIALWGQIAPALAATPSVAGGKAGRGVSVLAFGAVGDGRTDDTVALQRALDSVPVGSALVLPAGRVFAH